jgi:hypothetical protein
MPTNDQVILRQLLDQRRAELTSPFTETGYFELFAAEQVLKDADLSWDEVQSGIVADGGDGGIDGIFLFINGELVREDTDIDEFRGDIAIDLHIIQAKRTSGFSEQAVQKLRSTTEDLFDLSKNLFALSPVYNRGLLATADQFRRAHAQYASRLPALSFSYYYATLGDEVHPNVERQVTPLKETVSRLFSSANFSFDFIGARELLELTRRRPRTTYELRLSDSPISTEHNAYVCLVRLDDFYRFMTDDQGQYVKALFDANVRDHQGNVQVNRGIRDSLTDPKGEDFWWLNNGITILAKRAVLSAKTLTLEDPRVVNGLQTSLEIHRYFRESGEAEDARTLLVRVVVPEQRESYERIIRATNSQTAIPIASLRATDRVHRDIEDYFRGKGLYYDRRKNQYKNEGKPLDRIVSIGFVAQAVMSVVLGRPDHARARPSTLLKHDEDYATVFNDNYPMEVYLVPTLILRRVQDALRSDRHQFSSKDANNLRFHVSMLVSRLLLNSTSATPQEIAAIEVDSIDDDLIDRAVSEVRQIYDRLGSDDQVAKGREFVEAVRQRLTELTYQGRVTKRS